MYFTGGFYINGGVTVTLPPSTSTPATDTYFKYTSLLLSGNGTNNANNNTFVDSSTNNFTITRYGNTTQGSFSPYGDNWSNYFNGSTDYLSASTNAAFGFGTGDFTIEFWAYSTSTSRQDWIDISDGTNRVLIYYTGSAVTFYGNGVTAITGAALTTNTWVHYALVKSSGSTKLYVDGTQAGSTYVTNQNYGTTSSVTIGKDSFGSTYITGHISNVRIVKGTAVYTTNFTPSTSPLTAISGTSLLTCQSNRFIDNSTNAFTITPSGSPSIQRFSPFSPSAAYSTSTNGGSVYFDGTGDYLNVPANAVFAPTGDFSIMFWCYISPTASGYIHPIGNYTANVPSDWMFEINMPSGSLYVYNSGGATQVNSSVTIKAGQWAHFAMIRSGTTVTAYLNGVNIGTRTQTGTFGSASKVITIGGTGSAGDFLGYISDVTFVSGTAIYTSNFTPPSSPLTAVQNTSLLCNFTNAGIYDAAMMNDVETLSATKISTAESKFGGSSIYFDGAGDYLTIPSSANLNFGTADFTVECWAYFNILSNTPMIWHKNSANSGWFFEAGTNTLYFGYGTASASQYYQLTGITLTTSIWYHLAVTRVGTTLSIFLNGIKYSSTVSGAGASADNSAPFTIGSFQQNSSSYDLDGYIDDLRITKGYARYTSNFTPPTAALETQ